jgi:DNA mismatch endonuclease (patch repair protein)
MTKLGKPLGRVSDPEFRSRMMARVRQRGTRPETIVRKVLTSLGYRYRLNRRDLPGSPDIVFPGRRKILFVHGCFWHSHPGCRFATVPKTRTAYWSEKLAANRTRDARVERTLREDGWDVAFVWECETKFPVELAGRLDQFLRSVVDAPGERDENPESKSTEHQVA